ncbi:hypothetical protein C8J57DRAFT_1716656 [Mycena rebaudengoi]|nr:hypothetical protein C8J57DRAFT_1716656 [Mycena rebaudengoi]
MPHAPYMLKPVPCYAPPPAHPLKASLSYDCLSPGDELCIKRWLANRLNDRTSALPHMPGGFPFHYAVDGRGRGALSYDSYEFCEEVPATAIAHGGPPRRYWVTFSFTNHTRHETPTPRHHRACPPRPHKPPRHYMSWRAYVAVRDMSSPPPQNTSPSCTSSSTPALLSTPYGHLLAGHPALVLRAMGVSLDKGRPISIKLSDTACPGEVLFFSTDATGRRELLHRSTQRAPGEVTCVRRATHASRPPQTTS